MDAKRVVITGIGVIAPNAIGREAFFKASLEGVSGIKPASLFDTASFKAKMAGEIKDFNPQEFLGPKGLRTLDRSTRLVASAAKLALDDAGLVVSAENTQDIGVVIADTFGSLNSVTEFDREGIKEGPYYVNPALFPNTVINSPASQVSIKFNIQGFNTTISTGFTASLDALNYARDFLGLGRGKAVLAGGVEELCLPTFLGFSKVGCLAGIRDGAPELSCPFDRRRNGIILGEGSCILVLEDLDSAINRKAKIYAEVRGFGSNFSGQEAGEGCGLASAMKEAVLEAQLAPEEIDVIFAAASSQPQLDLQEAQAIERLFSQSHPFVTAVKSMLGESFSCAGSFQIATSLCALQEQKIPPIINYKDKDKDCDLNLVVNQAKEAKVENVLINSLGPNGNSASLVISRYRGENAFSG